MANISKSERNEQILLDIVEDYIKTAQPVSSGELLKRRKYKLSSATLRNIMAELDDAGFLYQPHTSAGRVPAQKAYQFFVDKVALGSRKMPQKKRVEPQFKKEIREAMKISPDTAAHILSRHLAEMTSTMAFAGLLSVNHFYKEGLRYILEEPEFLTTENVLSLVEYADSLEARLDRLAEAIQDDIRIYIGDFENKMSPFSLIAFASKLNGNERGVFGIIGPMRMRYMENLCLLNEIKDLFA